MKKSFIIALAILATAGAQQITNVWTSTALNYAVYSGWFSFQKTATGWKNRLYVFDATKFQVMQSSYSLTPQYTYRFSVADTTAGRQIYALGIDMNNDSYSEFYVLQYYGASTNYRQGYKIFDIISGNVIFERNDANYSYSYPTLTDIDNDGNLELMHYKYDYPSFLTYYYEVYTTGIATGAADRSKPLTFSLKQNFPNPFNPSTNIEYSLDRAEQVRIDIYDIQGKLVRTLQNGYAEAGSHTVSWNGRDDTGNALPTGVYAYTVSGGANKATRKMLMLR